LLVLIMLTAAAFVRGMGHSLRATGDENNIILLGAGSEESVERSEVAFGAAGVAAASIAGIREYGGTPLVSPEIHIMLPVRTEGQAEDTGAMVTVRGVEPAALLVHGEVMITEGRFPENGRDEVLVGATAA